MREDVRTTEGASIMVCDITDSVILVDASTTGGDTVVDPAGSEKPNPPACL